MDSSDTTDRPQQQSSPSIGTPEERYLSAMNTEVFGEKEVREALWAVQSLASTTDTGYVTKMRVAEKIGISVQELHNKSALDVLEQFGIVELTQKVNKPNEAYVFTDEQFCSWLDSAPDFGPSQPPDEEKFPRIRDKVERYGEYLDTSSNVKSGAENEPTPTEVNFELIAQELGVNPPISASVTIESSKMIQSSSSTQWRFEMEGHIDGDLEEVVEKNVKDRLQSEIFKRTIGALQKHRVKCTCETVREHLINVAAGTADFVKDDDCYVEVLDSQNTIHFKILITKIVSDNND